VRQRKEGDTQVSRGAIIDIYQIKYYKKYSSTGDYIVRGQ